MVKINISNSEKLAEYYATEFIKDYAGDEVFLGSDIERILSEQSYVIYQEVEDPSYFGAALHLSGEHFIAINTKQPLRLRYYSAAHELWHLQFETGNLPLAKDESIDQERSADRFAAAVMMPKTLIQNLSGKLEKNIDKLVITIADLSSMPYESVARRLSELEEISTRVYNSVKHRTENDWIAVRQELGYVPSPLDVEQPFSQFSALSSKVSELADSKEITLELAANLLKHANPTEAEHYWLERQKLIDAWDDEDDE